MADVFSFTHATHVSWDGSNWVVSAGNADSAVSGTVTSSDSDNVLNYSGTPGPSYSQSNDGVSGTTSDSSFATGMYFNSITTYNGTYDSGTGVTGMVLHSDAYGAYKVLTDGPVGWTGGETFSVTDTFAFCFLEGTQIKTRSGESLVEQLAPGDMILASDGREIPVKWVGRRTYTPVPWADNTGIAPIKISAGALASGVPSQDLYVTGDHAVAIDDMLVNASVLVNGDTIRRMAISELPKSFTYYHVETENHEEIIANGCVAETFITFMGRKAFSNYDEYESLYGCETLVQPSKKPRVTAVHELPEEIRQRLSIASEAEAATDALDELLEAIS